MKDISAFQNSGPLKTDCTPETIDYTAGNFKALVQKAMLSNSILKHHFNEGPKNASYLSPKTQNNLITCIGDLIIQHIVSEVASAGYFAVQADETTD